MMSIRNRVTAKLIFPLSDLFLGSSVSRQLNFLNRSQNWSREHIDNYQNQKLRSLIHHAYHNVPFYQELFNEARIKPEDIQIKKDLIKTPVATA